jgi:hypothetical protein
MRTLRASCRPWMQQQQLLLLLLTRDLRASPGHRPQKNRLNVPQFPSIFDKSG